ncbi:MAG: hypothetical protein F4X19_13455 [Acidobacteria bacterium]|nr:hypothetical protein [Acidobacteriota bacterium]MYC83083.1 hypothetical protein [Acidobacteriota bacterium]
MRGPARSGPSRPAATLPGAARSLPVPVLLIGLILVAAPPFQPTTLSAEDRERTAPAVSPGQALVERSLRAYGGEARILSLNSFVFAYRIESPSRPNSKPLSAKVYFNDSDRFRSEVQDGDLKVVTVLSGNRGWVEVAGTMLSRPVKQLSPLRNETLSLLRPDLLLLIFSRYRYSTRTTEEGRSLEQLEVTGLVDGEYIRGRLSINLDTGLIEKYQYETERATRNGTGIFRGEVRYLEYAEIHGLQSPRKVLSRKTGVTSQITVTGASLGKSIDPDLFREKKNSPTPSGQP